MPHAIAVKVLGDLERPKRGDPLRCLSSVRSLVLREGSVGMFWLQASFEHRARSATFQVRQDLQPHPIDMRAWRCVREVGGVFLPSNSLVGLELAVVVCEACVRCALAPDGRGCARRAGSRGCSPRSSRWEGEKESRE